MSIKNISCAPGSHIGENITKGYLRKHLDSGVILANYHHPDFPGTLEIDLVVINFQGVWLLEVKHWWGKIEADPIHWFHAGLKHPSPLTSIEKKAKVVNGYLREAGLGEVSVVGLVVLSKGTGTLEIEDDRADRVFGLQQELIDALTSRKYVYSRRSPILTQSQVDRVADTLIRKHVDPEGRIIGAYRLVEKLGEREGFEIWEGEHLHLQNRRALIKRYQIEAVQSQKHLDESVRLFKQDMEALARLEGHPHIVQPYDFLPDPDSDDTFWLVLEYVDGETLGAHLFERGVLPSEEQFHVLGSVADALAHCHDRGILHRNLTPAAIFLTKDGNVKIGNFDYSRVPTLGFTISETGKALVDNRYTAPEQASDPRSAGHRADLYSLGAVWYDMAIDPQAKDPILLHRIDEAPLSKDAKDLMRSLLSHRETERPETASEVAEWFELFGGLNSRWMHR